ncbi:NACHT domain-containing protein [Saccharopolyspora phatthalungensis]|uniref:MFS family permease n=1 Tax=Saccharopolyspora phatthalungensis TaxID=664693 RepID=A0A840QE22_9PSEU|nr:NACHT domain-containing protein [Saccharopolyspora phatthalungensis]MBB5158267.1 MFS family permease [Saccharopolyspora phatthalungensis]
MAEDGEIHNQSTGYVAGHSVQAGAVHGDILLLPQRSALLGAGEAQTKVVQDLATEVRTLSAQEMRHWGITSADALSVRWHTASEDLLDHWEKIHGVTGRDDRMSLAGHFTVIRDTYQAIHSKRLVILGKAGAGKTVLAHRLIIDLLQDTKVPGPVPVLFSLSAWSPASTGLQPWLVRQLLRDFPFLEARDPATRKRMAEALVDSEMILPVLDGFDEIPARHHPDAISEISDVDWPLVVTSRSGEYTRAAHEVNAVGRAAAIEVQDLSVEEAHRFLRLGTTKSRSPEWDTVFNHLRTAPGDTASQNLTPVLTTPLMVMLAHTIHNGTPARHPDELLDTRRFPTDTDIEEYLLGRYLDTVYRDRDTNSRGKRQPDWAPDRVRHWLGYLADHLGQRNTHDLTWWQLSTTLRRSTRILTTMGAVGLVGGLAGVLMVGLLSAVGGFVGTLAIGSSRALALGLAAGPAIGLAAGLATGLVNEVRLRHRHTAVEPERLRLRIRRNTERARHFPGTRKLLSGFNAGFAFGFAIGLVGGVLDFVSGLVGGFAVGLVVAPATGLAVGLVNVVLVVLGDSHDPREAVSPWQLLRTDRTVTLIRAILAGSTVGLSVGLVDGFLSTTVFGLVAGFAVGLMVTQAFLLRSTWGTWLLFGRVWLPLTGRLPWRVKRFLEDAYDRGVLRQAGSLYQFRHARLRDHLARHYRTKR